MKSLVFLAIASDACLLGLVLALRTGAPVVSPWQVLSLGVFFLYGLSSLCLFLGARSEEKVSIQTKAAVLLHGLLAWGLHTLLLRNGFGFDPFIHIAQVRHLLLQGLSIPHAPLYFGQYVLVAVIHFLTRLPLEWIERLISLASAVSLPFLLKQLVPGRVGWMTVFLIPLPFFTFLIPFHLSVFFLFLVLLSLEHEGSKAFFVRSLFALVALFSHPLAGIPACLIAAATFFNKKKWASLALGLVIALSLPLALFIMGRQYGVLSLEFNWTTVQDGFITLFGNPYPQAEPFWLWFFHWFLRLFPWLIACSALYLKHINPLRRAALFGLAGATFFSSFIHLPGIIAQESSELALRLVLLLPLLILPDLAKSFEACVATTKSSRLLALGFSFFALLAWYATYPPFDRVAHLQSPNLSDDDIAAIHLIERDRQRRTHAVLSAPVAAGYGLSYFGFQATLDGNPQSLLRYAIDRNGILSKRFFAVLEQQSVEPLRQTLEELPVDVVYFILPAYWDPDGQLKSRIQAQADTVIETGTNTVFRFIKKSPQ